MIPSVLFSANSSFVTQEIRCHIPKAGEVFLVWGINGWKVLPEENRPEHTVVKNKVMHTPMEQEGDIFVVKIQVPIGAIFNYCFLITKMCNGFSIKPFWDGDQNSRIITQCETIRLNASPKISKMISNYNFKMKLLKSLLCVQLMIGIFSR